MKMFRCLLIVISVILFFSSPIYSCSSFVLKSDNILIFGTNYDNDIYPGQIFINKKGIKKTGWEPGTTGEVAEWVSKYGSVTFNVAGYQLPWAGMNEKGLVISTMALGETKNPAPDERPPLVSAYWMQYIFDTCATVDDVIASDKIVKIKDTVDHYLICDAEGNIAVIEFLEGKMVVHKQDSLPIKALTNSVYSQCVSEWNDGRLVKGNNSKKRLAKVQKMLSDFQPNKNISPVSYSFNILKTVDAGRYTRWSIVFDIQNRMIYFKTYKNKKECYINFDKNDYGCETPALMMDIHSKQKGDVTGNLKELDKNECLKHFKRFIREYELEMSEEEIEKLFNMFITFPCD
ncbi:MAG: linear amide C-N hydrolase [bacterium]|nr:linear amide C-N hydrolase [bacterium]